MVEPEKDGENTPGQTAGGVWPYLGVGCLTAIVGLVAGGMIAVLIAKAVGAATGCKPDPDTGAPCDWSVYWTWGARIGVILVPTIVLWRMRKVRAASRNSE
jgi:hypothetical protein